MLRFEPQAASVWIDGPGAHNLHVNNGNHSNARHAGLHGNISALGDSYYDSGDDLEDVSGFQTGPC